MKNKISKALLASSMAVLVLSSGSTMVSAVDMDNRVNVNGSIGLDPATPPETLISITYSPDAMWAVTETNRNVTSASYTIENTSATTNLEITLKEFSQTLPQQAIPELTLNLTGDLHADGIGDNIVGYTGNTPYTAKLDAGNTWTYGFSGAYTGNIPGTSLQPTYDMVLNVKVDSVTPAP